MPAVPQAVESTLSQILEDNVPEKYYLSQKACEGILRRAERRGKKLPDVLKTALEQQSAEQIGIINRFCRDLHKLCGLLAAEIVHRQC